jgi:hypothetical protein
MCFELRFPLSETQGREHELCFFLSCLTQVRRQAIPILKPSYCDVSSGSEGPQSLDFDFQGLPNQSFCITSDVHIAVSCFLDALSPRGEETHLDWCEAIPPQQADLNMYGLVREIFLGKESSGGAVPKGNFFS